MVKNYRKYSENLKRKVAQDYLSGKFSYSMGAELYGLPNKDVVKEFVKWYRKKGDMSILTPKSMDIKESQTVKSLQSRIEELEKKLSLSQLKIESLETMVDIAEQEFGLEIKKKFETEQSVN
ncbi:MAG: transposase [Chitinophagales bacterium]